MITTEEWHAIKDSSKKGEGHENPAVQLVV